MSVFRSIRARLTASFALWTAVLMVCSCGSLFYFFYRSALREDDRAVNAALAQVEADWAGGRYRGNLPRVLEENSPELRAEGIAASVFDAAGKRGAVVPDYPHGRAVPPSLPAGSRNSEDGAWRGRTRSFGPETLTLAVFWAENDAPQLRIQAIGLCLLSLVVIGAVALGAWQTVGRTLLPIARLSRQAQEAALDLDHRPVAVSRVAPHLSPSSNDREITELVATLNALMAREAEAIAARGRFYAAASHELRTPLQALSGHLELALNRSHRSEGEYRAALEEARTQTRRLTALARDILLLHRLGQSGSAEEPDRAPLSPSEPVDLSELCARTLSDLTAEAERRGLHVTRDLPPNAVVVAPSNHAAILTRNLLDNAVRYASENGTIQVSITSPEGTESGALLLTIFNSFDADVVLPLETLQEPFHRPDVAHVIRGNGLGLAICRALAAADGWDFTLTQNETGIQARVLFSSSSV